MKQHILPAIKLTVLFAILFPVCYTTCLWSIAQLATNNGKGEVIQVEGKEHYQNIAQEFKQDKYFTSRPSAVQYNASASGGSNKGPSNAEYLAVIESRIDSFLVHNPGTNKAEIPAELVTASGSGLDPHLSISAAMIQAKRIAQSRGLSETVIEELIHKQTEQSLFGLLGPKKVNVLKLNIALDEMTTQQSSTNNPVHL
ncbi:MAG: K(+)-transporting ATPase subunit C [Flavobacteriales bacterium]|nr:K(+)-transporting ATPase subunit C [Flavobacteriales bacterium]